MQSREENQLEEVFDYFCLAMERYPYKDDMSTEEQLNLYSLYKQATCGNAPVQGPSAFQPRARSKWQSWSSLRDMSPEEAMNNYIAVARTFVS
jgi:acyl-CoA-binding protein